MNKEHENLDKFLSDCIGALVAKASEVKLATDALHFSQAACNVANTMITLRNVYERDKSE